MKRLKFQAWVDKITRENIAGLIRQAGLVARTRGVWLLTNATLDQIREAAGCDNCWW